MQDEELRNTVASLRQPTALNDVKLPRSRIVTRNAALGRHPRLVVHEEPVKVFEGHKGHIAFIATFPDGTRIATASTDNTIRIWRLEDGVEVMKWVVEASVSALAISRNGVHLVSSEGEHTYPPNFNTAGCWQLWVRDTETGSVVAGPLDGYTGAISLSTLDISPNDRILASSFQEVVVLWDTTNWQRQRDTLTCGALAFCIRFSPSGQLGVATSKEIQVWDLGRRERVATFNGHANFNCGQNILLTWTPDGSHLLSAGSVDDPVIRSWNASTWKQVGDPWAENNVPISHITLNPPGTLLASASDDRTVRLLQLPTGREVARYEHSSQIFRVAFSMDGHSLFGGGLDNKILQWDIPDDVLAAVRGVPLVEELKSEAGIPRSKYRNTNDLLGSEIPGRRPSRENGWVRASHPHTTRSALPCDDVENPPSSGLGGVRSFFKSIWRSSNKRKEKGRQPKGTMEVVDVPLGQATYGDYVASEEDGRRPYVLFFCLLWFQKKKRKPAPTPQVYDVDLVQEDILDVPIPTSRVRFEQGEDMELRTATVQSRLEAGTSTEGSWS